MAQSGPKTTQTPASAAKSSAPARVTKTETVVATVDVAVAPGGRGVKGPVGPAGARSSRVTRQCGTGPVMPCSVDRVRRSGEDRRRPPAAIAGTGREQVGVAGPVLGRRGWMCGVPVPVPERCARRARPVADRQEAAA